jgi:non-ribosomal peptide synthetase component F
VRKETEVAGPGDDAPGAVGAGLPGPGHYGPVVGIGAATVLEFIDQARVAFPDAPAIRERNRAVTHAELDRLAARVATVLQRTYGIGRGATVAIVATAGVDFTAALLGTIRAGAAYLPIDLAYPKGRIEEIFQASGATLIMLAGDCRSSEYVTGPAAESVDLTRILAEPATGEPRRPAAAAEAGDPAYVIFTSGSTGTPKGIVQTHRCLANFVAWQVNASGLGRGRRILQSAPLSFDVSVQEIFYALASGGCLCVPDPEEKLDPRDLLAYMIAQDIEVIDFPQSLIDTIMLLPENFRHAPALRHIISAGETVRVTPMLEALLHDRPEVTLYNHYGPAENHMLASHAMNVALGNLEPFPPVGSLVWNTYIRILDENRHPVADGNVGEI